MKKCLLIALLSLIALLFTGQSFAVLLYTTADAPVYTGYPSTNFDNYYHSYYSDLDRELWTGNFWGPWNTRSYLKFNLSGIPNVQSAVLWVYNGVGSGQGSSYAPATVVAFSTSTCWTENGITWNNQPALQGTGVSTTVGNAAGWYSWDVTSFANSASDGDLSIALTSTGAGHVYYASETSSGYDPYLEVVVPEPATIITFGSFGLIFLPFIKRRLML